MLCDVSMDVDANKMLTFTIEVSKPPFSEANPRGEYHPEWAEALAGKRITIVGTFDPETNAYDSKWTPELVQDLSEVYFGNAVPRL